MNCLCWFGAQHFFTGAAIAQDCNNSLIFVLSLVILGPNRLGLFSITAHSVKCLLCFMPQILTENSTMASLGAIKGSCQESLGSHNRKILRLFKRRKYRQLSTSGSIKHALPPLLEQASD